MCHYHHLTLIERKKLLFFAHGGRLYPDSSAGNVIHVKSWTTKRYRWTFAVKSISNLSATLQSTEGSIQGCSTMRSCPTEHAVSCVNFDTKEKHDIKKEMTSVWEKFISATNFMLVRVRQMVGGGLVIGKVPLLQEKQAGPTSLRTLT